MRPHHCSSNRISLRLLIAIAMIGGAHIALAQAPADAKVATTAEKVSALAHRLMEAGVKANALAGDELKPWHLKLEFQVIPFGEKKPLSGTMEEWYLGPDQWVRVFKSPEQRLTGTEWSVSKLEQYQSRPGKVGFQHRLLGLRVARPVIDPLYQAANVHSDYEMDIRRVHTAGLTLNCTSVIDAQRYVDQANPDWLFPTMCFDDDHHLHLTTTSDTSVQFEDLQPFAGRDVARDAKVIFNGALIAEMKVSLLEALSNPDPTFLTPSKDAVLLPYTIEPGQPKPVSTYEVGASVPLQPNGFPFRGSFPIPIIIHKDGSVKARNEDTSFWSQDLKDSLVAAINKWKYRPYLVDGQPVGVAWTVVYVLDGKPFVPSYERAQTQTAPPQQDSPPDGSGAPAHRRWH